MRAAFAALIDYAGLFPPASLSLAQSANEYHAARRGTYSWMLGRFVVPASMLASDAVLGGPFSVIVEPNAGALRGVAERRNAGVPVDALEIPLQRSVSPLRDRLSPDEILDIAGALEADLSVTGLRDVPAFVEIPRARPWQGMEAQTLATLARLGLCGKVRCGGVTADAFPSIEDLAEFVAAAADGRTRFKATAGLHHPVRHRDAATGFTMHGFLNLLAAAALAPRVPIDTLRSILAEEDAAAFQFTDSSFSWRDRSASVDELKQLRTDAFVGYGSCSFAEPIEDLTAMGILPAT